MEAVTTSPRTGMTRDDLAALVPEEPDDGHRYELIDGTLIVTPAPGRRPSASRFDSPSCSTGPVRTGSRCSTVADVGPDETWTASAPFSVTISPAQLL